MSLSIQVRYSRTNATGRLLAGLRDLTGLHKMIATRAKVLTRDHVRRESQSRHKSARRLGAQPTGHLERAAQSVASRSDARMAVVSVTSPGFKRVAGPLQIVPVRAPYLTIPAHRLSYGLSAPSSARLR